MFCFILLAPSLSLVSISQTDSAFSLCGVTQGTETVSLRSCMREVTFRAVSGSNLETNVDSEPLSQAWCTKEICVLLFV